MIRAENAENVIFWFFWQSLTCMTLKRLNGKLQICVGSYFLVFPPIRHFHLRIQIQLFTDFEFIYLQKFVEPIVLRRSYPFFFQKGGKSVSNKSKLRIKENHPPVFGWQLHVVNLCIIIGAKNIAKMLKMHFVTKRLRRKMVDACNLNHPDGSNKSRNKMPACKTRFWTFGRKTRTLTNN